MNAVRNWALCTIVASAGGLLSLATTGWTFEVAFLTFAAISSAFVTIFAKQMSDNK